MDASRRALLPLLLITLVTACAGKPALTSTYWHPRLRKAGHFFE